MGFDSVGVLSGVTQTIYGIDYIVHTYNILYTCIGTPVYILLT